MYIKCLCKKSNKMDDWAFHGHGWTTCPTNAQVVVQAWFSAGAML